MFYIAENFLTYIEKFDDDTVGAFAFVIKKLKELLGDVNFDKLKDMYELICTDLPHGFVAKIKAANTSKDLLKVLELPEYCNWLNIRVLKRIVMLTEDPIATSLIDAYEQYLYSKKISEVQHNIKLVYFYNPNHFSQVEVYINKSSSVLIVRDVVKLCHDLEGEIKVSQDSFSMTGVVDNCIIITCAIPVYSLQHVYEMAKKVSYKFRKYHIRYLKIGFFPKVFTFQMTEKEVLSDVTKTIMNCKLFILHSNKHKIDLEMQFTCLILYIIFLYYAN